MDAVNGRVSDAMSYFSEPVEAWHLISEERLDDVGREFLGDDSPSDWLGYVYPNTTGNVPAIL